MKSFQLVKTALLAGIFVCAPIAAQAQKATPPPSHGALEPSDELTVFPHVTTGAGWNTSFVLFNVTNVPITYRMVFYNNQGEATDIKLRDRDEDNEVFGTLQPRASVRFETEGSGDEEETDYWAALEEGSGAIAATQTFRWTGPDGRTMSATVPISDDFSVDPIFVPFDNENGGQTALVITNTDNLTTPEAHTIRIEGWDEDGNRFFSTTREIESGDKPSFLLSEEFPELANRRGIIYLDAEDGDVGDFAVLALQVHEDGDISAVLPFEGFSAF